MLSSMLKLSSIAPAGEAGAEKCPKRPAGEASPREK